MRSLHATILLASVSSLGLALPATAQTATPASPAAQQDGESQDMVVVTGSRIPGRTLADSPVPVDVIGAMSRHGPVVPPSSSPPQPASPSAINSAGGSLRVSIFSPKPTPGNRGPDTRVGQGVSAGRR